MSVYRNKSLAGTYGSSLSSLTELQGAMQRGDFHREGSEIVYAGGKRMSLADVKSHMENVENIGIVSFNETHQAFRATKSAVKDSTRVMASLIQV